MNLPLNPFYKGKHKKQKNHADADFLQSAFLLLMGILKDKGTLTEDEMKTIVKLLNRQ